MTRSFTIFILLIKYYNQYKRLKKKLVLFLFMPRRYTQGVEISLDSFLTSTLGAR